jgi:DUF4097 and DUF4098 domain-containing protein YvlB
MFKPTIDEEWDGQTLRVRVTCLTVLPARCAVSYVLRVPAKVSVEAHTKSGDVSVRDLAGNLRLSTKSGDVNVADSKGTLWAHTSSGDVTADGVRSGVVDAESTSGNVILAFERPPAQVSARGTSGNVEVAVPRGVAYAVDAKTTSGNHTVMADDPTATHKIMARTVSGNVEVSYAQP